MEKFMKHGRIAALLVTGWLLNALGVSAQTSTYPEQNARRRIAERAAAAAITNAHNFGIYMPREDVLGSTRDVEERIRNYLKAKPEDIPLAKYPVISDKDIANYDWETHTVTVTDPSVLRRVRTTSVWGAPFVFVADGKPIYVGAFYSLGSSQSCPVPVILADFMQRTNTFKIERGYPTGNFAPVDFRPDPRVKEVLRELNKLK
jgi:hypothetical protein